MEELTLPELAKKLEKYIMTLPAAKQFNKLSSQPRQVMMDLSDSAYSLRVNCQQYFSADDSEEQKLFLMSALEYSGKLQEQILIASQHDLLGPVDVAHLSALSEQINERLS